MTGLCFSFPVVLQGYGLCLGYNNHRCPVSIPHPQSTVQSALSTLDSCARLALISYLVLNSFDQSVRCTVWEQIVPTLLSLCWWDRCVGEVPTGDLCSPFEKSLFGATATPNHYLTFHTLQLSGKSRIDLGPGQSQPTSFPSSRCHQVLPNSLALSQPVTVSPAWVHRWLCVLVAFFSPSDFICSDLPWHGSGTSPP